MRPLSTLIGVLLVAFTVFACTDTPIEPVNEAASASPLFSSSGIIHHASMGGADACGDSPGCDANFSLVANMHADGSVNGQWQDSFGHGNGGVHVAIDCLVVVGSQAVVGGVVTKFNPNPDFVGTRALTSVVDNGTSAGDPLDQLSFSFFGFDPGVDCNTFPPGAFPLNDLAAGQVKVW
jgi:hypothetical protein